MMSDGIMDHQSLSQSRALRAQLLLLRGVYSGGKSVPDTYSWDV